MEFTRGRGVLGLALAVAAVPALADTTLEMEIRSDAPMRQVIQVSNGRVRVNAGGPEQDMVVLFREGAEQYQVLDPHSKTVMTMTLQQARQTLQQTAGMMQQMQAMMAEQMKNMPPEQRAQMEQMMGQSAGGKPPVKPQIRNTGRSDKVGAWRCEVIEVIEYGQVTSDLCVVQPKALGIPERDYQTLQAFFKLMARMTESAPPDEDGQAPFFGPEDMPGVPVRAVHRDADGQNSMQLTKVSSAKLEGGLFQVPAGYKPMQMPTMPGMPMR